MVNENSWMANLGLSKGHRDGLLRALVLMEGIGKWGC